MGKKEDRREVDDSKSHLQMQRKYTVEYLDKMGGGTRASGSKMPQESNSKRMHVGIQAIIPPRNYISPTIAAGHRLSLLDFPRFLYMPHTLIFLVLGIVIVLVLAFRSHDEGLPFFYYMRRYEE